ncbi:hypothetical protein [Morganella morganii IS15]|nr:hypothetical protein CSB69_2526 [Morganella morganii]EMP50673.1 hypothetical protein C790_02553 [Morganella morganii SC01]CDK65931.1 hypothetical protein [Morganella morganii IS15]
MYNAAPRYDTGLLYFRRIRDAVRFSGYPYSCICDARRVSPPKV